MDDELEIRGCNATSEVESGHLCLAFCILNRSGPGRAGEIRCCGTIRVLNLKRSHTQRYRPDFRQARAMRYAQNELLWIQSCGHPH